MDNPEVKSLYKYKPINQFTLDIIANDRIFFPAPDSFNDQFDTKCSFNNNLERIQSTDLNKFSKRFPGENPSEMMAFTRKDMSVEISDFNAKLKGFGILSLAEGAKDMLMWSHYAADHKGLCIEFERTGSNDLGDKTKTKKVNYTKNYPSLSAKALLNEKDISHSLMRVLYTKSECWAYEKEWRMFMTQGNKVYPIPGKIKSITFGVRASEMDIDIVQKLIAGRNITLHKAVLKENEFGIKLEKIS